MKRDKLLEVKHLKTYFKMKNNQIAKAVDDVSFTIYPKETVCIVGESGSGKTATALSIMQLIASSGEIVSGEINFLGENLIDLPLRQMNNIRGKEISMIFQEASLNPVLKIGRQMTESIIKHEKISRKSAFKRAKHLLTLVGFSRVDKIINEYPHQLSGGMRQRVMIAIAMACNPKILIADEPTTALDVTTQSQILDLLLKMKEEFSSSVLLITHDLGVVAETADRVIVMYGGQIVEEANVKQLFKQAKHPYTQALLKSIPTLEIENERLETIRGTVPPAHDFPSGCRFANRCQYAFDICHKVNPELVRDASNHSVRCHLYDKEGVYHGSEA